ncbi:MAG: putative acetamidase/formamidase [Candidatus Eremiobacteraeota bacterium]|nr:putative acetamidase/formamidase [Candidatus Eremiobacteraeota bacterium]
MFGCSENSVGKRFAHAVTEFLNGDGRRRELRAHDAIAEEAVNERYEGWRMSRAAALKAGGAAAAFALADTVLPDAAAAPPTTAQATDEWTSSAKPVPLGRVHTVTCNAETTQLGLLDPTRAPLFTVDSGDVISYQNTWTHFLNRLQPGVSESTSESRRWSTCRTASTR